MELRAPLRADMATLIASPAGFIDSQAERDSSSSREGAREIKRRAQLRTMLVARLARQHGAADTLVRKVVELEVEKALHRKKGLTEQDLDKLESDVEQAVRVAQGRHTLPLMKPRPVTGRSDMATATLGASRDLSSVADWNAIASYQNNYLHVAQQQLDRKRAHEKERLASLLAHQRFEAQQRRRAAQEAKAVELARVEELKAKHAADERAEVEARRAKTMRALHEQREQVAEREARRAVEARLKHLEATELTRQMHEEEARMRAADEAKRQEMRRANQAAVEAGMANLQRRKEAKAAEDALSAAKKAEWAAMLDKQERDREEVLRKRREKIESLQRDFEMNAGAEEREREMREARMRQAHIERAEAEARAEEERRRAKRDEQMRFVLNELDQQVLERHRIKREEKEADRMLAREQQARAAAELRAEQEKSMRMRATATMQVKELSKQVEEKQRRKVMSSRMSPLEVALNRDLLVAVLDHKYDRAPLLA